VKAVILAAGRGSRMKERTKDRPKCLVSLAGRTLLDLQLTALKGAGITDIGIVSGYLSEQIAGRGLQVFRNDRWRESNMVVSLCAADAWLRTSPCIVSYADIFYPVETVLSLVGADADLAVAYDPDWLALWNSRFANPLLDAETFRRDLTGRLVEIGRRAETTAEIEGQYMGLLKFTPAAWQNVVGYLGTLQQSDVDRLDMTTLLSRMIALGQHVGTVPTAPFWGEVDSDSDLAYYEQEVAAGRLRLQG